MPSAAYLAGRYMLAVNSSLAYVAGYAEIFRQDAIRSSCMECVEKHLGSALVLMSEVEAGYPSHKLLAIGHLNEAAEESAELRPHLSKVIRNIRKAYQSGEPVHFDEVIEALERHGVWRFDRRGEGVACGRAWISRLKKCSKSKSSQTPEENKRKTVEKQKARQTLRRQVELAKGQKPYVKSSAKAQEPASKRFPLHKRHLVTTDARITPEKLETALDAIDSPGAQERMALVRQIINNQEIQAVFNDTGSKVKKKTQKIIEQLDDTGYTGYTKGKIARLKDGKQQKIDDQVLRIREMNSKRGRTELSSGEEQRLRQSAAKSIDKAVKSLEQGLVANKGRAGGYTLKQDKFVTVKTNSREKPIGVRIMSSQGTIEKKNPQHWNEFKIPPGDASRAVDRMISQHKAGSPDFVSAGNAADIDGATRTLSIYLHEVGHQVRWGSNAPKPPPGVERLTRYSRTNSDEFFAEHFTAWVLDAEAYKKYDSAGADFIEQHVRKASEAPKRITEKYQPRGFRG
ncbi:MAG: hypothetical protein AAFO83_00175 [Cyanobacteria bacterium J06607_13]